MKVRYILLLVALGLIISGVFFFTQCRQEKAKVTGFSVKLINTEYTMKNNIIQVPFGDKVGIDENDFKVSEIYSDGTTKVISQKSGNNDGYEFTSNIPNDEITPAGEYYLTFKHSTLNKSVEITIIVQKESVDMSAVQWDYTSPFTYDAIEKEVKIVNLPVGVRVSYVNNKAKDAGTYFATAIFTCDNSNMNTIPNKTIEWKIEKAILKVEANAHSIVYGDDPSNNGVNCFGFKGNDSAALLSGMLAFDYSYTRGDDAGTYSLTPKGLSALNYNLEYVSGVLTVLKKNLTIKVNDVSIPYNTDVVNNGISSNDFVNGDTILDLGDYSFDFGGYTKGCNVREYIISIDGTFDDTNYNIEIIHGILTVTAIDVNIDTSDIDLKVNEFTYDGTNIGNKLEVINLPYGVSCKNIVVKDKTAVDAGDYVAIIYLEYFDTLNYNPMGQIERSFVINKATVESLDFVSLSFNSVIYNGYEQIVELKNIPVGAKVKTDALIGNKATDVGTYTVNVVFTNSNSNYVDFELDKTFTWNITPAPLRIVAKDKTIVYGEDIPMCGIDDVDIYTFVGVDDKKVLEGNIAFDCTYQKGDDAKYGAYTITPKGLTAKNYHITFVSGYLNVEKAQIDFKNVDWIKKDSYIYSGYEIKPILNFDSNDAVKIEYYYIKVGGGNCNPIDVGTYKACAEIIILNNNYEIKNNNILDYEFTINPQEIDCSSAIWQGKQEYVLDEEILKPVLINLPSEVNVTYNYFKNDIKVEEIVEIGVYVAIVFINPINSNFIISKYPTMEFNFIVTEPEIDNPEDQNSYNIRLVVDDVEYLIYKDGSLENLVFDSGRSVYIGIVSLDAFLENENRLTVDCIYVFEGYVVEDLCASSHREVELTDGYAENVWFTIMQGYDSGPFVLLSIIEYNVTLILQSAD